MNNRTQSLRLPIIFEKSKKDLDYLHFLIKVRIFSTIGTKLVEIAKERFLLESEVQHLTEANLQDLFDLTLVKSEFELHGLRIDTLAFDKESGAFVIIEYKKDR
jgi:RecB family endonuclease NucS